MKKLSAVDPSKVGVGKVGVINKLLSKHIVDVNKVKT